MNNKIVKLAVVLFLICAVTAGVLGVVNQLTYKRIELIQNQKKYAAFAEILPSDSGLLHRYSCRHDFCIRRQGFHSL